MFRSAVYHYSAVKCNAGMQTKTIRPPPSAGLGDLHSHPYLVRQNENGSSGTGFLVRAGDIVFRVDFLFEKGCVITLNSIPGTAAV